MTTEQERTWIFENCNEDERTMLIIMRQRAISGLTDKVIYNEFAMDYNDRLISYGGSPAYGFDYV